MKKSYLIIIVFLVALISLRASAYIMCNDGERSKTCTYCHQGCCSGHLGCKKDSSGNDVQYEEENRYNNVDEDNINLKDEGVTPNPENEEKPNYDWVKYLGGGAFGYIIALVVFSKK